MTTPITRRTMLATTAAVSAAALAGCKSTGAGSETKAAPRPAITLKQGATVLLQGDSITDAGRDRKTQDTANNFTMLGNGYAKLIAFHLLSKHADKQLKVYNRGISGNRVPDLQNRWQQDCLDLKPEVVSILIGVNDIWRKFDRGSTATTQDYADQLSALLATTKQSLPGVQVVICEPFVLRCGAVKDEWFPEFDERRAAAKSAAQQAGALWVPFHEMFEAAVAAGSEPNVWAGDGVHPSAQGQALMAARWLGETGLA